MWRSLTEAFTSFSHAAGALENSYAKLQAEVAKLRFELEQTNRDLSKSLEDNQRMRAFLGRILEGLPCGVLVFDQQLQLRVSNPAACRLLQGEHALTAEGELPTHCLAKFLTAIPDEALSTEQEWTVPGAEGEKVIGVTRAWLTEGDTSGEELILILRDMTEQRRLESEREAIRRTQALAEMAMVLAHEIRNPLGSLELFAGLLADATESQPEVRQWVDHLQAGLRSLSATVNNVLHLHSQPPSELVPINLVHLLSDTISFLQPLGRQRGLRLQLTGPVQELWVQADPHRLQQAFLNLALNAFRAMNSGGLLHLRVGIKDTGKARNAVVEFEDEGSGIAPEHLPRIFEAGFSSSAGSLGLGLAVTKKVVEQHGGTISVRSSVGQGTTFTLIFPARGAEA